MNSISRTSSRVVDIVSAAQLACLLEVGAPKPGNVSPGRPFIDVGYEDFVASAVAIGEPLSKVAEQPLGVTIRAAVEATRRWTLANTNLGLVLVLTPLAKAAVDCTVTTPIDLPSLRQSVERVLAGSTVEDARDVYAAIRAAAPGGLGDVPAEDVRHQPTVTLQAAMRLAAHRDSIAREYVTGFDTTFAVGVPALQRARENGLIWNDAIVETFLEILSRTPDTHIARRAGDQAAMAVTQGARRVVDAGGVRTAGGQQALAEFDAALRDVSNLRNPGTTADLTVASLFVVLLNGGWGNATPDLKIRPTSRTGL